MAERTPGALTTGRVEAFSDGVIAIAITLLILEIDVPEPGRQGLWHALGALWPSYAAYLVSFFTIGIMWVNHHTMFTAIARPDRWLLFLNLALLAGIAFLPFPTAVLARYVRDADQAPAAAVVYGLTMVAIGICFTALIAYLQRHPGLLAPGHPVDAVSRAARVSAFGPLTYAVTSAIGAVLPLVALVMYGLIAVFFALGSRVSEFD